MQKTIKKININQFWIYLFILWLLSFLFRLSFILESNFPLHDGGFFYTLILDLQQNHFQIPLFSSFNQDSIPYTYPPLAFYLTGFISSFFHTSIIELLRFLPPIISSFTVPVFGLFALEYFAEEEKKAIFATLCFTLLPLSNVWLISGGGITRSLGDLFCILALFFLLSGMKPGKERRIWIVPIFSALTVLSHPEAAFFLAYTIILFLLFFKRSNSWRKIILFAGIISGGTLLLSSPWWVAMFLRHGSALLQPLFDSGFSRLNTLSQLLFFKFTGELSLPVLCILGIVGIIVAVRKKDYILLVWLVLPFIVQSRAADQRVTLPIALAAGECCFVIYQLLFEKEILSRKLALSICGFFIIFVIASTTISIDKIDNKISPDLISAINWLKTQDNSQNVLIVQPESWVYDSTSEWVATLSGHHASIDVQGYEWKSGFSERIVEHEDITQCFTQGPDCVVDWTKKTDSRLVFIPIADGSDGSTSDTTGLIHQLEKDNRFSQLFFNKGAAIFQTEY